MNHYDEEILRLNKKIKQLIWTNEQSEKWIKFSSFRVMKLYWSGICFWENISDMSRTGQLEAENKRLTFKVNEMKEICSLTSSLNVKYKMQLDKETTDREDILEANHKLKLKLNSMSVMCNELNQRIKVLEYSLQRKNATRMTQPQVRLISSVEDIVITRPKQDEAFNDLQKRHNELDAEHQEALNVIDELEFELGDVISLKRFSLTITRKNSWSDLFLLFYVCLLLLQIDYLEMETQRLQQENIKLKEMLQQAGISWVFTACSFLQLFPSL